MDGDESALTSYYHHHHPSTTTTSSAGNGVFSSDSPNRHQSTTSHHHYNEQQQPTYPTQHSLRPPPPPPTPLASPPQPSSQQLPAQLIAPQETVKRKRGRPRKYGTPEAPAVKKLSAPSSSTISANLLPSSPRKKEGSLVNSSKKNQLVALGNAGQNFVPHIITVTAGEDVYQKIMSFTQQRKRAVCILSASGSISNASLRQPATLGGTVTYEGRFEILSLSGSYLHTETEGGGSTRKGGLSVCLSSTDGRIIGGGVGGPLTAAGPVQVIIGSFVVEANKETNVDVKYETSSSSKLPQVIGTTFSSVVYNNNDHQNFGVNSYMFQTQGMHSMPSQSPDWRDNTDIGACQSSEDGDDGDLHH